MSRAVSHGLSLCFLARPRWKAVTDALEAQHTAHMAAAAEMRHKVIAPLKEAIEVSHAKRDRLLRPIDKVCLAMSRSLNPHRTPTNATSHQSSRLVKHASLRIRSHRSWPKCDACGRVQRQTLKPYSGLL